ncbi:MAG: MBL fold metallo-hydrolase [Lentisphaeria bacterium]|nr:MBL fold metallo-hydrolase [Lentisphaeria bacterium]
MPVHLKHLAILALLCAAAALSALNWPVTPEPELHGAAMERVAAFAKEFAGTPDARAAEALLRSGPSANFGWIGGTLEFASGVLERNPPQSGKERIREAALRIMDYPLHVNNKAPEAPAALKQAWQAAVDRLHARAMERMLREIDAPGPETGLTVWKFYNMGFVVKSRNRTIGFDLWPGAVSGREYTPEQLDVLTRKLDALFISHEHGDHVSRQLAEALLKAGKTVVAPEPAKALPGVRSPNLVAMYGPNAERRLAGMRIRALPGTQGKTPCNVYIVTLDGMNVIHNGDNTDHAVYHALAAMGKIDLALSNCWSGFAPYFAPARPAMAVTAHENELSHRVQNRESFKEVFERLGKVENPPPVLIIDCGESVRYPAD